MKKIVIKAGHITAEAELNESKTAMAIWQALPLEGLANTWGEEIQFYDEASNECVGGGCGHYTQIVWSNSTELGCGTVTCDGVDIWVCQYNPAGNVSGERPY